MVNDETLSEKKNLIHCDACGCDKYECYEHKDVREAIKKLKEELMYLQTNNCFSYKDVNFWIKEVFGEELC